MRLSLLAATLALAAISCQQAPAPAPGGSAQLARYTDIHDQPADVFSKDRRATVLLFVSHDCPISNAYAPEIHRLCDAYANQGVAFYLVYPDPDLTAADARKHHAEYGYRCGAILDREHRLTRLAGATITPEAAVFRADGTLVYRGRIDDVHIDYRKSRQSATTQDLRRVLEAVARNQTLTPTFTEAVGCHIPDLK